MEFDLFEAHLLQEGLEKEAPGSATIVMKPRALRKGFAHALIEIGLNFGQSFSASLFASWLYNKWKQNGEKRISVKIENRFYQFDVAVLTKALEDAIRNQKAKEGSPTPFKASSEKRSASGPQQRRRKSRS